MTEEKKAIKVKELEKIQAGSTPGDLSRTDDERPGRGGETTQQQNP